MAPCYYLNFLNAREFTMTPLTFHGCTFEPLLRADSFLGLGRIAIDGVAVRLGRLPLIAYSQSLRGMETSDCTLRSIDQGPERLSIHLSVGFRPVAQQQAVDWNLDHVLDTSDWDTQACTGGGELTLHIMPASETFNDVVFRGFSYHWEYAGSVPLYWLLDRASWEIGGDVRGSTVYSQSLFTNPIATFDDDTPWSTELKQPENDKGNRDVLQFWPRWVSLQPFDFQFNDSAVLVGIFDRLGLIRSVLKRDVGGRELKTLDRHIFDATTQIRTVPKSILLAVGKQSVAGRRNLWTSILDTTRRRALAEVGMKPIPLATCLHQDFWKPHTFDDYRQDLLSAAIATGVESIRLGNINRSNASQGLPGNQCESHEYVVADSLGGAASLKALVQDASRHGIDVYSWTSTAQSPNSPIYQQHRGDPEWFVRMEDGRQTFGGTHSTDFQFLNLASSKPRNYWVDSLKKIKDEAGINGYFWDMAANVSYIPINYLNMHPRTMWRQALDAVKALQDAGIALDGLCGPFVRPGPGHHGGYQSWDALFMSFRLLFELPASNKAFWTPSELFRILAHGSVPVLQLFYDDKRIDTLITDEHRTVIHEFRTLARRLTHRVLRDDGAAVEWPQDDGGLVVCNLVDRSIGFDGTIRVFGTRTEMRPSSNQQVHLLSDRTYEFAGSEG